MGMALDTIDANDLMEWTMKELGGVKNRATDTAPAKYISPATANRKMNALRRLLTNAFDRKIVSENPGAKLEKEDEGSGIALWLKPDEERRLRAALNARGARHRKHWLRINADPRCNEVFDAEATFTDFVKPAVLFALNTGLRRNASVVAKFDGCRFDMLRHLPEWDAMPDR
ncbi:hypothetical protein [uncultured Paraburkholderia sp.]|uniref:hypothetical protein n=1 Tax=uncultured Paraburkholderia sp. TaxID=1822466 RepID=UPI0025971B5C|nr:hypothetical protein [uncultured Paraburkholderia sp.]